MKNKGGKVYGSIYERKRKDRNTVSWTAEIQFQGHKIRRTSKDKEALSKWMSDVCISLNEILGEYQAELDIEIRALKLKRYSEMLCRITPLLDAAKDGDMRFEKTARANGIISKDHFQTYLIEDEETGLTKIGKSHDIYKRILALCRPSLRLIAYCDKDIEVELHQTYKARRIKGEWFDLSEEERASIISDYDFRPIRGGLFLRP